MASKFTMKEVLSRKFRQFRVVSGWMVIVFVTFSVYVSFNFLSDVRNSYDFILNEPSVEYSHSKLPQLPVNKPEIYRNQPSDSGTTLTYTSSKLRGDVLMSYSVAKTDGFVKEVTTPNTNQKVTPEKRKLSPYPSNETR